LYFNIKFIKLFGLDELELKKIFFKPLDKNGAISMKLAMNIPCYVQDAQKEYIDLLDNKYIQEIYLMAPYFSDDKVASSLIKTANKMKNEIGNIIKKRIKSKRNLDNNKKAFKKKVLLKLKEEKKFIYFFLKTRK
jgi:replicative superfamily II helicase